ncbi:cysteine desulfurase [Halolactibacillus halophilus]|uniref:Aminotransferase V n=1 Tax=Halolactibacillus halophilus TaxID=306540 RepID=A0A1I5L7R0_9BACI|nr:cysteine desulfurase family protein [Halolactibacillus halophilus]GEM00676.1 aminotransferase V [Halolactibacillus halophilus]SFO92781.1 cysteine desulfurase [Halolactibacillus halophilus]
MIYFDNSATTKPHEEVIESYQTVSENYYGNPSSQHQLGYDADKLLRKAYEQAASMLGVSSQEIVFTSGGTESNNLAIKGIALRYQKHGKHLVTTTIEHPSVLEVFKALETLGFEVSYVPVDVSGVVKVEAIKEAVREDTILVSVMHINNEIGTIQPVQAIGEFLATKKYTFFHVDHVQGYGKVELDIKGTHIDLLSVSGHKIHGLKGTGLLYLKENVQLFPLFHGGGQQKNLRSGTENIAGIVSLVKAMRMVSEQQMHHPNHLSTLKAELMSRLATLKQVVINTPEDAAPHIINFSVPGFKPEVIVHALEERRIFVSTKSACASKSPDESAVLKAINLPADQTKSALRISFSYQNSEGEIELFYRALQKILRDLSQVMG